MGLLSLEELQAELIADEADRLQRLKELAEDEALALNLHEEELKGLEEGKKVERRGHVAATEVRRIKRRAGRVIEEVIRRS